MLPQHDARLPRLVKLRIREYIQVYALYRHHQIYAHLLHAIISQNSFPRTTLEAEVIPEILGEQINRLQKNHRGHESDCHVSN